MSSRLLVFEFMVSLRRVAGGGLGEETERWAAAGFMNTPLQASMRQLCSVSGNWLLAPVLTLHGTNRSFGLAVGIDRNAGWPRYSRHRPIPKHSRLTRCRYKVE